MKRRRHTESFRRSFAARWRRLSAAGCAWLLAVILLSGGPAEGRLVIERLETERFPEVELVLSVTGGDGAPLSGLRADDLALVEAGRPLVPGSVRPLGEPLAVALVVDNSQSMKGAALAAAQQGVTEFLSYLGEGDEVLLVQTAPQGRDSSLAAEGLAEITAALPRLTAAGTTAYYDAVLYAIEALSRRAEKRKAVIALSDGWDTASTATLEECAGAAQAAGIPIFCIDLSQAKQKTLQALAEASGGGAALGVSPQALRDVYRGLAGRLIRPYRVQYHAAARGRGERWRLVEVSLPGQPGASDGRQYLVPGTGSREGVDGPSALLPGSIGVVAATDVGLVLLLARRRRRRKAAR